MMRMNSSREWKKESKPIFMLWNSEHNFKASFCGQDLVSSLIVVFLVG